MKVVVQTVPQSTRPRIKNPERPLLEIQHLEWSLHINGRVERLNGPKKSPISNPSGVTTYAALSQARVELPGRERPSSTSDSIMMERNFGAYVDNGITSSLRIRGTSKKREDLW